MDIQAALFLALSLAALFLVFYLMVKWVRGRSAGAIAFGSLLAVFAPDPTLEAQIRIKEETTQEQAEEDEEGEPKN